MLNLPFHHVSSLLARYLVMFTNVHSQDRNLPSPQGNTSRFRCSSYRPAVVCPFCTHPIVSNSVFYFRLFLILSFIQQNFHTLSTHPSNSYPFLPSHFPPSLLACRLQSLSRDGGVGPLLMGEGGREADGGEDGKQMVVLERLRWEGDIGKMLSWRN